jgi:hypothetical protein
MSAAPALAVPLTAARTLSPFPTTAALALERATWDELETAFVRGASPDIDALIGWEFRGINRFKFRPLPIAEVTGIKKFLKGFFRADDGRAMGYNSPVAMNALDGRWHVGPKRFGFYEVYNVDPTARDNAYLHAVMLDYSRGGNKPYDLSNNLRDYVVQVDPGNPDLLLGKAFYALGPARVSSNFFILERHRVGLTDYARR